MPRPAAKWSPQEWARFAKAWNDAESAPDVADRYGMSTLQVSQRANRARKRGLRLKHFNKSAHNPLIDAQVNHGG